MAQVVIDDKNLKAIADKIREGNGDSEDIKYLPSEMPSMIDFSYETQRNLAYTEGRDDGYKNGKQEGYDEGYTVGYGEAYGLGMEMGKSEEYNRFWDTFQNNGGTANYYYAFAYNKFNDENYNPKYDIRCSNATTPGQAMFLNSSGITDTKVVIYANANNLQGAFQNSGIKTIRKIVSQETTAYTQTFNGCDKLTDITFEGVIGQSINFGVCPLTAESIVSVVGHLSDSVTGKTATFKQTAINNADWSTTNYASWEELKATKPNWGFAYA